MNPGTSRFVCRLSPLLRKWHRWVGLAVLLPCVVMSLTGILLIHPGLYEVRRPDTLPTQPLSAEAAARALAATLQEAAGRGEGFRLKHVDMRFHVGQGWVIIVKGVDPSTSAERELIRPVDERNNLAGSRKPPSAPPASPLKKWVKAMHTGEIFGKPYSWLWADLVGASLIFLAVSGLFVCLPIRRGRQK
jgi:uncharacterized iron-regulated membrane protein